MIESVITFTGYFVWVFLTLIVLLNVWTYISVAWWWWYARIKCPDSINENYKKRFMWKVQLLVMVLTDFRDTRSMINTQVSTIHFTVDFTGLIPKLKFKE